MKHAYVEIFYAALTLICAASNTTGEIFPFLLIRTSSGLCVTVFLPMGIIINNNTNSIAPNACIEPSDVDICRYPEIWHGTLVTRWLFKKITGCPCNQSRSKDMPSSPFNTSSTFVILDFQQYFPQDQLSLIVKNLSRLRDYHNTPTPLGPLFMQAKFLADLINGTLITSQFAHEIKVDMSRLTTIHMNVFIYKLFSDLNNGNNSMWHIHHSKTNKGKLYISLSNIYAPFNHGYCAIRKLSLVKPWDLYILLIGFNSFVWIFLLLTISGLIGTFYFANKRSSLSTIVISLISPLITESTFIPPEMGRCKYLFVFWMFGSTVLITCYTGKNASFIIKPPEEETLPTLSDVADKQFSMLFLDQWFYDLLKGYNNMRQKIVQQRHRDHHSDVAALSHFITKWEKEDATPFQKMNKYIEAFALREKVVILTWWYYLFENIGNGNKLIQDKGMANSRRCYLGKRVIPAPEMYEVLSIPPGNVDLFKFQQVRDSSGISVYWSKEFVEAHVTRRVQDRARAVSPTKIVYEFENIRSLKMEGKMLCIFFLWGVGLGAGFVTKVFEWMLF